MTGTFPWGYFSAPDDSIPYESILMDHSIPQSASPAASFYSPFPPPVLQEYLNNDQRTAIFNADIPSSTALKYEFHTPQPVGITPVHRPPHARFASPISSSEPSSASGSAHSPPADAEYPSSPPEEVLISPYMRYNTQWTSQERSVHFGNMGPEACVNPVDVNSQQLDFGDNESDTFAFDFGRTPSWDSYSAPGQCDVEPTSYPQTVPVADASNKRMMSPEDNETPIKEEIEAKSLYPESPLGGDSDEEKTTLPLSPKRKADNDDEWKPSKKVKSSNGRPTARPRPRSTKSEPGSPKQPKKPNSKLNPEPTQPAPPATARPLPPRPSTVPKNPLYCREQGCPNAKHSYPDKAALDAHTKKKHTRPYICVFHFAGCDSTFASKNEWKRHVNSQHILLNYWLCQEDDCIKTCNGPSPVPTNSTAARGVASTSKSRPTNIPKGVPRENIPNGAIFNRKDLYTQHMRRMHMPEGLKKKIGTPGSGKKVPAVTASNTSAAQQWEDALRQFQEDALKERCKLPQDMTCPAPGCTTAFHGPEAWDQRMEHVARHLDAASQGKELPVEFGGEHDTCLTEWAGRGDVAIIAWVGGRWVLEKGTGATAQVRGKGEKGGILMSPVKSSHRSRGTQDVADEIVVGEEDDDLDAEGEPDI